MAMCYAACSLCTVLLLTGARGVVSGGRGRVPLVLGRRGRRHLLPVGRRLHLRLHVVAPLLPPAADTAFTCGKDTLISRLTFSMNEIALWLPRYFTDHDQSTTPLFIGL